MSAIALYARRLPGYEDRVAASAQALAEAAHAHAGRVVQASSLGIEDNIVTDLAARHALAIPVATLATGMLHAETLALVPRLQARYGITVEIYEPRAEAVVEFVARHGEEAMFRSVALRKSCCAVRKLEPLGRMLAGRDAWVTGLRREQSAGRSDVPVRETDGDGRLKLNPLAAWSLADVWQYAADHDVPYNPLHDRFYPSIGCAPCTRAVGAGEDVRSGRWWWEDEAAKECGLHVKALATLTEAAS